LESASIETAAFGCKPIFLTPSKAETNFPASTIEQQKTIGQIGDKNRGAKAKGWRKSSPRKHELGLLEGRQSIQNELGERQSSFCV